MYPQPENLPSQPQTSRHQPSEDAREDTPSLLAMFFGSYAGLVGLFMPRPLHDEVDYRNALAVLDAMAGFEMNADQEDYFEAIATFVEKYEAEHHAIDGAKITPVELIRSLMDEHGMSESDLGRLLGDRSLGHRILSGERELSKAHIRVLADYFSLNPATLL